MFCQMLLTTLGCIVTRFSFHSCCNATFGFYTHVWQARVEIEAYSVTYFDCNAAFEVWYR